MCTARTMAEANIFVISNFHCFFIYYFLAPCLNLLAMLASYRIMYVIIIRHTYTLLSKLRQGT